MDVSLNSAFSLRNGLKLGVGLRPGLRPGDISLMEELGVRDCILQLDWGELEPVSGRFDNAAMDRLRQGLSRLRQAGIRPVVALGCGSGPAWFQAAGGWTNPENIQYFLRYTEKTVRWLNDLAGEYITLSALCAQAVGATPSLRDRHAARELFLLLSVQAAAHIRAYRVIYNTRARMGCQGTRVGFSLVMEGRRSNRGGLARRAEMGVYDRVFRRLMPAAMARAEFRAPIKNYSLARPGQYSDFCTLEYVTGPAQELPARLRAHAPRDDRGREIWPEGMLACAGELYQICDLPVYIGGCVLHDREDAFRARFLYEHVGALCISDTPVERFYYAPLSAVPDSEGLALAAEGGLKRSGRFYARMRRESGVSRELYREYVQGSLYRRAPAREEGRAPEEAGKDFP